MTLLRGFPPLADARARVLVLGSMPGKASLRAGEYYGHPRNAFWPIMGALFAAGPDLPYAQRCARLTTAGVAVWDVLETCHREGSLDSAIESGSERANDFAGFLSARPGLHTVFFNGAKAEQAWRRHVARSLADAGMTPQTERLPSTSPAHAALDFAAKLNAWQVVARAARPGPARRTR